MFSFLSLLLDVIQVVIAAEASIVCFILAGLTLGGSAVGLTVTTPLFIIFSPILVPATIATAILTTGFTAGGTLGALAIALIRNKMGGKGKNRKGSSSAPSSQNLLEMPITGGYGGSFGGKPFSGTFGNNLVGATAPPAAAPAPAGGIPGHEFGKILVILKKLFPEFFGPKPANGAAPSSAKGVVPPPADGGAPPPIDRAAPTSTPTPAPAAGKKPAPAKNPKGKKPAPAKNPAPAKKPAPTKKLTPAKKLY